MKASPVWPSALYFLYFASLSAVVPYLALFYRERGLSGGETGLLLSVSSVVSIFASPFWSGLADARRRHRLVLIRALAIVVAMMVVFPLLPAAWYFPFIAVYAFFVSPIISLVDSATFAMLGERRERYGRLRIWGTIGWGLCAPLAGAFLQKHGLEWGFWIYAAGMFLALFPASRLTFQPGQTGTSFLAGLRSLLTRRRWVVFLGMTFVAGIGLSVANSYLSLLMESRGGRPALTGLALTVATLAELPVMFFSYLLLRRLKTRGLFLLAIGVTGLRSLLYAIVPSPAGLIVVQLLHGFTFPALWVAGVTFTSENTPPGLSATAQGIFGSTLVGFGAAAGSLLGGWLMEGMSPAGMYAVIGAVVLSGLAVYLLFESRLLGAPAPASP
jgi:oligosaccharide:H+ symporter